MMFKKRYQIISVAMIDGSIIMRHEKFFTLRAAKANLKRYNVTAFWMGLNIFTFELEDLRTKERVKYGE